MTAANGSPPGFSRTAAGGDDHRRLAIAVALIVSFMALEVAAGVLYHSLALLSDAAHMLTDAVALVLSLVAVRAAAKPARGSMTFGLGRVEILSAQFNGATLLVLGLLIVYVGIHRLISPPPVVGTAVLAVALAGIVVNLLAVQTLSGADRRSLNIRGAIQHVATDLAAFVFTAVAGAVILATGFRRADGIAALIVAAIMLRAAYGLLRDSGRVFLEAAPAGLDPERIGNAMAGVPGVVEIHDLHVWEVTSGFPALSAHVLVGADEQCHELSHRLKRLLHDQFEIEHTTLQVEHASAQLLTIEGSAERHAGGRPRRPRSTR